MTPPFAHAMDIGLLLVGVVLAALALTMIALGVRSRRRRGREPLGVASLPRESGARCGAEAYGARRRRADGGGRRKRKPTGSRSGFPGSISLWRGGGSIAARRRRRRSFCARASSAPPQRASRRRMPRHALRWGISRRPTAIPSPPASTGRSRARCSASCSRMREHDAVEARMRRNGCPTDWVLTDF